MFDVGFWELILIAIMGLVILGPERLPVAIRTVRGWMTGARKFSDTVKAELTEELRVHELHANLKKAEQANLQNLSPEVAESLKTLQEAAASVTEPFKKVNTQPLDSMISSSLASSVNSKALEDEDHNVTNIETADVQTTSSTEQSAKLSVKQAVKAENAASDKPQL
ncbi:Sec-independent protein translocase protein TatB [Colwellia psychrerythraea]|uniref:Sec-independent protein translocase protein TatB n=1 Tax=Colwellia psychrerythraea TaxID=28229 RepID=A0A099L3Q7_COLPS|nr:Sec-independent protein translocase protein TatB [Colwellia psychrerythraea]KGJ97496.1 Sec-independent protein translocase protein tatB-like protein [Colwellia psychrerythraea]